MNLEETEAYKKLRAAVDRDLDKNEGDRCEKKFQWIIERVKHYAEKTDIDAAELLAKWEERRDYWYMNYYQESKMPLIEDDNVKVFDTQGELIKSVEEDKGFRCPACGGVSSSAYECDSGIEKDRKVCDWKSYGLFGCLGKGATIFVKENMAIGTVFKPVAWE